MRRLARSAVLVLALAACAQKGKVPRIDGAKVVGTWRSDALPAADASGRVYELVIADDGRADLSTTYVGKGTIVERGTWDGRDSLVRVVARKDGTGAPQSYLFTLRPDSTLALAPDTVRFGTAGLVLRRVAR